MYCVREMCRTRMRLANYRLEQGNDLVFGFFRTVSHIDRGTALI